MLLHLKLGVAFRILQQLQQKLSTLLRPTALRSSPCLCLHDVYTVNPQCHCHAVVTCEIKLFQNNSEIISVF